MRVKWWYIAIFVAILIGIAIVLHPSRMRTGWMYLESHKAQEAVREFRAAYEKDPKNPRVISHLAMALEATGNTEEAGKFFEELLSLKPRNRYFKNVVRYYNWTEQPHKVMETYARWYAWRLENKKTFRDKDGEQILNELYAYYLLYQNYEGAIDVLKTWRKSDPARIKTTNVDLITLYEMSGDLEATVTLLERILGDNSLDQYALEKFMEIAVISGKEDVVEGYLVKNVENDPDDPKNWQRLINYETRLKRYDVANSWYAKWLEEEDQSWDLRKRYVAWLVGTKQDRRAVGYLQGVLKENPPDPYYRDTLIDLYKWNQMHEQLVGVYQERFRQNPHDRNNANELLGTLIHLKRYDEAERVLKELTRIYPDDREYAVELANVYDAQNNSAAAISVLEKAVERTDDVVLMKRLGEMYLWAGDRPVRRVEVKGP
jgi:tetratricopeptide (TPR) repeat protein